MGIQAGAYRARVFPIFSLSHLMLLTSLIIIATALITVLVADRYVRVTNREARLEAEMNHFKEIQNLNLKIRSQRHDFYNHITSLYGYMRSGQYDNARSYMESLYGEIREIKELLDLDPPALGAIISLKREAAEKLGVELSWDVELGRGKLSLSTQELTQVIGNLLDNAIEAAGSSEEKTVKVTIEDNTYGLSLAVVNSSRPVPKEVLNQIFLPGVTTKDGSEHSGLGLYIVKQIVERHQGVLNIGEPEGYPGLEIQAFIPKKSAP